MKLLSRRKKADPLSDRTQALNAEIEALEAQIRELGAQLETPEAAPAPNGHEPSASGARLPETFAQQLEPSPGAPEPSEPPGTPAHFNDLGVRKYDLAAAWRRLQLHFRGPAASNPRLINYLAAGSIQGLRPLRYEKRVARNRVLALTLILLVVLWGIIATFVHN